MTWQLFDFQEQALAAEAEHRREHPGETRLAIVLPTGTGKATILAERARRFADDEYDRLDRADAAGVHGCGPRQRVLVIVHTNELVEQLEATIRFVAGMSEWPITVGVVKADRDQVDADIVIGSRQTLEDPARRARISGVGLVMVDECHIGFTAYGPIMRHFGCMDECICVPVPDPVTAEPLHAYECFCPATPALGFTATLERSDGAGLGQVWQDVAFTRDTSWAIRKGYLVQPIGYRLTIELNGELGGADSFEQGLGNIRALDAQVADSIAPERAVEKWMELAKDRPTILFAPLVRSARAFRDVFLAAGIRAAVVYGDMPDAERRQVIADFKAGRITVLCNAMVLTAGFDHPAVSCVMVMRPTQSRTLFTQMAGRGLRRVPGIPVEDQDCILISLADGVSDLRCHVDLSDRPLDPKAEGALTVMEDEWDLGKHLDDQARHWTGRVDATQFDPLVARSSKVWQRTKGGVWFVPISTNREYVFLVDADIFALTRDAGRVRVSKIGEAPDVELAMQVAEDEATERGGDLGALVADRTRPWRKRVPEADGKMLARAGRLGLSGEVDRIMKAKTGGKAGKVSDLIRRVEASRSIDPMVIKIKKLGEQ
jgi:superfamily II DNA or RNA helicase